MILPVNFLVGLAVGAATTYMYKDEKARHWVGSSTSKLKSGTGSVLGMFRKKNAEPETPQQAAEPVDGTVEKAAAAG